MKKVLAITLVLCMLISAMGFSAIAATPEQRASEFRGETMTGNVYMYNMDGDLLYQTTYSTYVPESATKADERSISIDAAAEALVADTNMLRASSFTLLWNQGYCTIAAKEGAGTGGTELFSRNVSNISDILVAFTNVTKLTSLNVKVTGSDMTNCVQTNINISGPNRSQNVYFISGETYNQTFTLEPEDTIHVYASGNVAGSASVELYGR